MPRATSLAEAGFEGWGPMWCSARRCRFAGSDEFTLVLGLKPGQLKSIVKMSTGWPFSQIGSFDGISATARVARFGPKGDGSEGFVAGTGQL